MQVVTWTQSSLSSAWPRHPTDTVTGPGPGTGTAAAARRRRDHRGRCDRPGRRALSHGPRLRREGVGNEERVNLSLSAAGSPAADRAAASRG